MAARLLIVMAMAVSLPSCTDEQGARRALLDAGFHPINVQGYGAFDCSGDDVYRTRFTALSPDSSRVVTGCVCRGWLKGSTIRTD